jgi:hypothetical protein
MQVRKLLVGAMVIVSCSFVACEDDPSDVIVNATLDTPNVAPAIALTGPEFPGNTFSSLGSPKLRLWVVVSDGNGLDDIAGVFMTIGSIQLNGVIARPDISSSPPNVCDHGPDFVDNNDVDISSALPASLPGFTNIRLFNSGDGVYESTGMSPPEPSGMSDGINLVDLESASVDFTPTDLSCVSYFEGYSVFMVNPPAVPSAQNVFITYVDMTLRNISVTVYDAAGATATATFPDIRTIWSKPNEETTLP